MKDYGSISSPCISEDRQNGSNAVNNDIRPTQRDDTSKPIDTEWCYRLLTSRHPMVVASILLLEALLIGLGVAAARMTMHQRDDVNWRKYESEIFRQILNKRPGKSSVLGTSQILILGDIFSTTNRNNCGDCKCGETFGKCKVLMLLRHAKSSWKDSDLIDDFDRHLAPKGVSVAHEVGRSLRDLNVKLPEAIFSSPSVRTKETLNIVLKEWIGFEENKNLTGKTIETEKKWKELKRIIQYDKEWYDLSDDGYLNHLVSTLSDGKHINQISPTLYQTPSIPSDYNRVMIVGHNPAMEQLLSILAPLDPNSVPVAQISSLSQTPQRIFSPGALFELCFCFSSWVALTNVTNDHQYGNVTLHLP